MPRYIDYMRALAKETGWQSLTTPDSDNRYRVSLEGDIELEFVELAQGALLLRSEVGEVPLSPNERAHYLENIGRLMVGVRKYRPTHIALENQSGREICIAYRKFPLSLSNTQFFQGVEQTINDIAWWKRYSVEEQESDGVERDNSMMSLFSQAFSGIQA